MSQRILTTGSTPSSNFPFVSYGGLGRVLEQHNNDLVESPPGNIVFMNTNTPSTTIICGVQGSGKSHSVGVIVENSLISMRELGSLPEPLSVTVFHLSAAQGGMHLPCESAFIQKSALGVTDLEVPVYVLVSPSNLVNMRESYAKTGATVRPFYLSTKDLNCSRMLSLMHVEEGDKIPLYMEVVQQILRSMGSDAFDYRVFKREIDAKKMKEFSQQQRMPLDLRFQLLEAMLLECQKVKAKTTDSVKEYFKPGRVTIIDLTDPFINASAAAALFDIALSLYLEAKIATGKLLVLDEAHKVNIIDTGFLLTFQYLTNKVSDPFVNSMFSVIRQQRHLGIRTIVSTQEPTVVPEDMIGLCSTVICHRFSSPLWWKHLKRLVPLDDESSKVDWFDRISRLKTGECIVFCPLALTAIETGHGSSGPTNLGRGCMLVKVRRKVTETSGQSVLSVRV